MEISCYNLLLPLFDLQKISASIEIIIRYNIRETYDKQQVSLKISTKFSHSPVRMGNCVTQNP